MSKNFIKGLLVVVVGIILIELLSDIIDTTGAYIGFTVLIIGIILAKYKFGEDKNLDR